MPNYKRGGIKGCTYFFTVVTYKRQPILCNQTIRESLRNAINETRKTYPFDIDACVLIPDHLHCIWTLPDDSGDYSKRWAIIKRIVSKQCHKLIYRKELMTDSKRKRNESTLWQRRYWEHLIRDQNDFNRHMDYIHWNPVKHGCVKNVSDWQFSTFHKLVKKGFYDKDWGSGINIDNNTNFGE